MRFLLILAGILGVIGGSWYYMHLESTAQRAERVRREAAVSAFCVAEDVYRRTDYNKDGVLEYSKTLRGASSLYETPAGKGDLALIDRSFAAAQGTSMKPEVAELIHGDEGAPKSLRGEAVMRETGELATTHLIAQHTSEARAPAKVMPGKVHWARDAAAAFTAAENSRRPVLLFYLPGQLDNEYCCSNSRLARTILFSDEAIAATINGECESAWVSVRPVPTVTIDFGNGTVVTRTLHGNIATCVCSPEGEVVEILGGLYTPRRFGQRLKGALEVARKLENQPAGRRVELLKAFHDEQIKAPAAIEDDAGKSEVENWKLLIADTAQNDGALRREIQTLLRDVGLVKPEHIVKRVFKEVLKCDMDDPYLGMKGLLFDERK